MVSSSLMVFGGKGVADAGSWYKVRRGQGKGVAGMAVVVGLNFSHDGAAAVVKNGRLVSAVAKERLDRRKRSGGVTRELLEYVLEEAGATLESVDAFACGGFTPYHPESQYLHDPHCLDVFLAHEDGRLTRPENVCQIVGLLPHARHVAMIDGAAKPLYFVQHHLSHCASAFYTSNAPRAACFSVDSSYLRPEYCSLFAVGDGKSLAPLRCPNVMIGNMYSEVTGRLGLGDGLNKAGTTMGLAAYGVPDERLRLLLPTYLRPYDPSAWRELGDYLDWMWTELSELGARETLTQAQSDSSQAMRIAANLQFVFEETLIHNARLLAAETAGRNDGLLCLSGGSMLNCDANTGIVRRGGFERAHLFPGCGDDGTAVGAALYVAHAVLGEERVHYEGGEIAYLGRAYPDPDIGEPLDLDVVARCIADGGVVAWHQGRGEFGPRALGARSILADPRRAEMRDVLNFRIKKREWFRPFAPAVLAHRAEEWFDISWPSRHMLFLAAVKQPDRIPAATHVDGTARPQTVERGDNPRYFDLIERFEAITGVPVLLNTSLNVNREPLVETPADALRFFEATGVDMAVIGGRMLRRAAASS
jgi:carbamoyltransferase